MQESNNYSTMQIIGLTTLRIMIGWHFLYEGLTKLYTPVWTAKQYLLGSVGPLSSTFKSLTQSDVLLGLCDKLNIWGLILIGLSLFIGLFSKIGKISGIAILLLYYLAYPPFQGLGINPHAEGSYWIVNKNLIEIMALIILLLFPISHITGIDRFIFKNYNQKKIG